MLWADVKNTPSGLSRCPLTLLGLSRTMSTEVREFAIVPLHAAPLEAVAEMDSLYDVYLDVRQKWDLEVSPWPRALGVHAVCPRQAAVISC